MIVHGKFKVTLEEYHSYPAVGSSGIRTIINQSPAHYWHNVNNPSLPTPAQALGTAIHQAILEPKLFKESAVVEPVFSGTGSRAAREEWHLENHGKTILKQDQLDAIHKILESISHHKQASKLMSSGAAEKSFFWKDAETDVQCKARPDFIREGHIIIDVKSTEDASYHAFQKDVAKYGYAVQAAMYLEGVSVVLNQQFDTFIIVAIEKRPPYALQCFQLDENTIREGQHLLHKGLATLKSCQASGIYPAYGEQIVPLALPSWAVRGDYE